MTPAPRLATFDCYGTLIDWEGGVGAFLYALLLREGVPDLEPGRVLRERWEEIQFQLIQGDYRPYKEILTESLRLWMEERGLAWSDAYAGGLIGSMRAWQPFPDTVPALRRTREAGMRLAIVSNSDRDIIEHSLRHLEVPFDHVITAEDAGAYKPSDAVFDYALNELGVPPDEILHVAFGFKYDIGPANRHGMRSAWVNRHQEPPPGSERYDHEWRDLWGLAELAESAAR